MAVKSGEKVRTFPDDIVGETGEGERVFPFSLARMSAQDTSGALRQDGKRESQK